MSSPRKVPEANKKLPTITPPTKSEQQPVTSEADADSSVLTIDQLMAQERATALRKPKPKKKKTKNYTSTTAITSKDGILPPSELPSRGSSWQRLGMRKAHNSSLHRDAAFMTMFSVGAFPERGEEPWARAESRRVSLEELRQAKNDSRPTGSNKAKTEKRDEIKPVKSNSMPPAPASSSVTTASNATTPNGERERQVGENPSDATMDSTDNMTSSNEEIDSITNFVSNHFNLENDLKQRFKES